MKKLLYCCMIVLGLVLISCKQPNGGSHDSQQPSTPPKPAVPTIAVSVHFDGSDVPITDFITTGIPCTATQEAINADKKLTLSVDCKDPALDDNAVTAKITEPAENPPLTITKVAGTNTFEVTFREVVKPVPVTIVFTAGDGKTVEKVSFKLLPEPTVTGITCTPKELTLGKDFIHSLEPQIICTPEKIGTMPAEKFILPSHKNFSYVSSNTAVVTVSSWGSLHTKAVGTSDITISLGEKRYTVKVTVEDKISPDSLKFKDYFSSDISINLTPSTEKELTVQTYASGADITLNEWSNSNSSVGTVETVNAALGTYKVKALSNGVTELTTTAKYNNSLTLKITLTVSDAVVNKVTINPDSVFLAQGATKQLTTTVEPYGAPTGVRWESGDSDIVTVDETGLITARKKGTAYIRAYSTADSKKYGLCSVTVADPVESVTLNKTVLELTYGSNETLTAVVQPATAAQALKWSSSDSSIATVYSDGDVHASWFKTGSTIVTASSKADPSKKASCTVYVAKNKVSALMLSETAITMDTNSTKYVTLTILPADSTLEAEYKIEEGAHLTLSDFKKSIFTPNQYNATITAGALAETKTITFTSKANPEKKAVLTVTTKVPPVASVTIPEKNISLFVGQTGKQLTAKVLPSGAVQTVKWTSGSTSVVTVDENTGMLTPVGRGSAVITAESTQDPAKKDTAIVTVKEALTGIASLTADKTTVYYGEDANLTAALTPAGAFGDLEWMTNNADCTVTKDPADETKAVLKVVNPKIKDGTVKITVKPRYKPTLKKELTIAVKTIVPQSIAITCSDPSDKMYQGETLQFTVTATGKHGAAIPASSEVTWKVKGASYWAYHITDSGKLTYTSYVPVNNGSKITVVATSKLDDTIKAEKEITVYNNIAEIIDVECINYGSKITEWTLGDTAYPQIRGNLKAIENVYLHFVITEKSDGTPISEYLETAEYEVFSLSGITIKPKTHTKGAEKTFYVFPVDPKTGNAATDKGKTFPLTVWEKPTGIEITKGNFTINGNAQQGYTTPTLPYGNSGWQFYARIVPEFAKQELLDYKIERVSGNHTCIVNHKKCDTSDKPGWLQYQFDTNSQNSLLGHDYAKFVFTVKKYAGISTSLLVDSN